MQMQNQEIGKELKASDLKIDTVVVTNPEHKPDFYATMWVKYIGESLVALYAGIPELQTTLILLIQPDGTVKDNAGRTIRLFEYLGEI